MKFYAAIAMMGIEHEGREGTKGHEGKIANCELQKWKQLIRALLGRREIGVTRPGASDAAHPSYELPPAMRAQMRKPFSRNVGLNVPR